MRVCPENMMKKVETITIQVLSNLKYAAIASSVRTVFRINEVCSTMPVLVVASNGND